MNKKLLMNKSVNDDVTNFEVCKITKSNTKVSISCKWNVFSSNELDHYIYMKECSMAEK